MTIFLTISAGLVWLFSGLVGAQLVWKTLPNDKGSLRYEWGPFMAPLLLLLVLSGPVSGYFYVSHLAADRIFLKKGSASIQLERERLLNTIYQKAIDEDMDIAEIGQQRVEDLELRSNLPTL